MILVIKNLYGEFISVFSNRWLMKFDLRFGPSVLRGGLEDSVRGDFNVIWRILCWWREFGLSG